MKHCVEVKSQLWRDQIKAIKSQTRSLVLIGLLLPLLQTGTGGRLDRVRRQQQITLRLGLSKIGKNFFHGGCYLEARHQLQFVITTLHSNKPIENRWKTNVEN